MKRASYLTVKTPEQMQAAIEKALRDGVSELHIGHKRCGICGIKLGSGVEKVGISPVLQDARVTVYLCLCAPCFERARAEGWLREVGKG